MGTLPKVLFVLALWLLYIFGLYWLFPDTLCTGCGAEGAAAGAVAPAVADTTEMAEVRRYPIDFQWDDPTAFTNAGYDELKQRLAGEMTDNNRLVITGLYFENEAAPSGFANMGFARADRVRQLLSDVIPPERVETKARLIDEREGIREGYFEGALFEWETPEEAVAETVEELEDRINIRFPYNSTEREYNPEVEDYLRRLADNLKETGRRVSLTGHTDNSGEEDYNQQLGMRRARQIQQILVNYGVPAAQIEVASRGESQPTASNDTEEGRHENRRVELRILDQ